MGRTKLLFPASDSLGVRSMANFLLTESGTKIAIDPGAALAPRRYGLPPHPIELHALEQSLELIKKEINDSSVVVITHYHRDHYPQRKDILDALIGKTVIMKHPSIEINRSQKLRASLFQKELESRGIKYLAVNSGRLSVEDLKISIEGPFWHGEIGTPLGKIIAVVIDDGDFRYYFASDSQGPVDPNALNSICSLKPNLLYISGPPNYFESSSLKQENIRAGMMNLEKMISSACFNSAIIDHHFAREKGYESRLRELMMIGKDAGVSINDVAGFVGVERKPLESMRRELYK
ncbi:MAG: hypothetical protein QXM20_00485 [Fervidicoccaceae archaeon]